MCKAELVGQQGSACMNLWRSQYKKAEEEERKNILFGQKNSNGIVWVTIKMDFIDRIPFPT